MDPWLIGVPIGIAAGLAGVTAYGAVNSRAQLFGHTIWHTDKPKKLAITFDDGPNPAITPKLLKLLEKHGVKATFFLVGKYVRASPSLAKEIVERGHTVGNHTETHPNLFFCGPEETRNELLRCSEAIGQATWEEPRWFRPPFGYRSPWLGSIALRYRMRMVMWTLIPGDWKVKPEAWLVEKMKPIAERVKEADGSGSGANARVYGDVLCIHDGDYAHPNADRRRTLAALEYWLPRWRDLGLEFATIGQSLGKAVEG
ncbi:MAG TPA: polysaccharide deacetylase family protein [Dongiaceae bacterium]|nr:polysaccharide deacetylase family protein [Dongiaceae bacterium]